MTSDLPTPEQQEATARRYRGQRALVAAEVVQEAPSPPTAPPVAEKPTRGFRRAFWHWARWVTFWTLMGLIVAAIGGRQVPGPHFNATVATVPAYPPFYPLAHPATVILAVALGVLVCSGSRGDGCLPPPRLADHQGGNEARPDTGRDRDGTTAGRVQPEHRRPGRPPPAPDQSAK